MKKRPFALDFCTPSPRQRRLIRGRLSVRGNGRLGQFVEQRLCLFEVGRVEAFGETAVGRRGEIVRFRAVAPVAARSGKANGERRLGER
jgi:hypothetical protein